jgi:hypothetical protein
MGYGDPKSFSDRKATLGSPRTVGVYVFLVDRITLPDTVSRRLKLFHRVEVVVLHLLLYRFRMA